MPEIIVSDDDDALNFYGGNLEAFQSKEPYVVLVGPADTGKTFMLCWKMHLFALKYPGVRILMTRKSLRALRDSAVVTFKKVLELSGMTNIVRVLGETRPTNFIYPRMERIEDGVLYSGSSEIILAPLDTKGKALGSEYNMAYINQPDTEGTTLEEFNLIKSRCRLPNSPYRQLICDPNPAHDKHWLLLNSKEKNKKGQWRLITSTHKDNPALYNQKTNEWTELGLEQIEELSNLPGNLRESLFKGEWFSTAGMAFAPYWSDHKHILRLETQDAVKLGVSVDTGEEYLKIIPKDWHHYLSIDWGFGDPYVALLIARHPKEDLFIVHQHIYLPGKDIYEVANLTAEMIDGYNIKAIIADRGRAESTVMEGILGRTITTAVKGSGSVIDSMNICIAELNSDRWKFLELKDSLYNIPDPELERKRAPMGYDEIPNLKKDSKDGKIASGQADHFYDAWKYFCRYWINLNGKKRKNNKFIWI